MRPRPQSPAPRAANRPVSASMGSDLAGRTSAGAPLVSSTTALHPTAWHDISDVPVGPIVQRKAASAVTSDAAEAQAYRMPNRTGLPDRLKAGLESLSSLPMDDLRVHYNSAEPARLQAHAFTKGADIHLAPGQEHHLGHEAWHAVQQRQGRVRPNFRHAAGVPINDSPALEAEADRMGARLSGAAAPSNSLHPEAGAPRSQPKASPTFLTEPVAQRVVTIGGALLNKADDLPLFGNLTAQQQQAVATLINDRASIHAFATLVDVITFITSGNPQSAPAVTPIPDPVLKKARAAKNRAHFDRQTEPEPTLSKHPAFHKIPREQLYSLPEKRWFIWNPLTQEHERRRRRGQAPTTGEELLEYVDPSDPTRENYGYLRNGQMLTSRTDPTSTARLSRSGAGTKTQYKDKRGGMKNKRKHPGLNGNKPIQPFKRRTDNKTFTIGHSVAVKNMSRAVDPGGLNSDEQPKMMVPENRTVGEQMKNPALEPEDRAYVWRNRYPLNPDLTFSGHPIPQTTQATIFKPDNTVDFNVRLVNDGSVDYAQEREKKRGTRKEYSYRDYMLEHTQVPVEGPALADFDTTPPMTPMTEPPGTPEYLSEVFEEETIDSATELVPGTTHQHGGQDWWVGWSASPSGTGKHQYQIGRTNFYKASDSDKTTATSLFNPPSGTTTTSPTTTVTTTTSTLSDPMQQSGPSLGTPSSLSQGVSSLQAPDAAMDWLADADPIFTQDDDAQILFDDQDLAALFESIAADIRAQAEQTRVSLTATATRIDSAVPPNQRWAHTADLTEIAQMLHDVQALDPSDLATPGTLNVQFGALNQLFRRIESILTRPVTQSGGDARAPGGSRLPVLAQFFAECGQMAAHNVLALSDPANLATYPHLLAALHDAEALRLHGNFPNNINEDYIRGMIAHGGGTENPVIGNIGQIEGQLAASDHDLANVWNLAPGQMANLAPIRAFIEGTRDEINLVLNTESGADLGGGHHWITVRVERRQGELHLFYGDSLDGPADYSVLFTRLKQMLGGAG